MEEYNISYRPGFDAMPTHDEVLRGMQGQLSDQMFYLSLILLGYILLNMFVFRENTRFRKYFDVLNEGKYKIEHIGTFGEIIYQIIETIAFIGSMVFVILNMFYRGWINI